MDALSFVASIVGSLAWPVVALVCVYILRDPLLKLTPLLKRAKYKDVFELQFGEKLEELEKRAESLPEALPAPPPPLALPAAADAPANAPEEAAPGSQREPPPWAHDDPGDWVFGDYIARLAPISPRAAIIEAWRHVETALHAAFKGLGRFPPRDARRMARDLHDMGALPRDAVSLLEDLRALRNRAAHANDFDLEPMQAIEFGRLAERMIASIRPGTVEGRQLNLPGVARPSMP